MTANPVSPADAAKICVDCKRKMDDWWLYNHPNAKRCSTCVLKCFDVLFLQADLYFEKYPERLDDDNQIDI